MKDIEVLDDDARHYAGDVDRIIQVMAANGFNCSRSQAFTLWEKRSQAWAAGWLHLPEDDRELFNDLQSYFRESR